MTTDIDSIGQTPNSLECYLVISRNRYLLISDCFDFSITDFRVVILILKITTRRALVNSHKFFARSKMTICWFHFMLSSKNPCNSTCPLQFSCVYCKNSVTSLTSDEDDNKNKQFNHTTCCRCRLWRSPSSSSSRWFCGCLRCFYDWQISSKQKQTCQLQIMCCVGSYIFGTKNLKNIPF